ncbi:HAT repeat-containing protein [Cavenderia fasciculata]|uniref:HAT repeat-containing protein n=1 Tax=Cavenderia fasciculata TaxID=261658 RepID=F4PLR3_CACFS|nr:HAT repeat-containing protein [Cavenderia fasciculata]EGG23485.1 HAT repeat-containing protein [Cavenderia fasciculata]|eukprot:XP_004361336.1 HAT repeat-containing protein [Cavenderia fasciculata]
MSQKSQTQRKPTTTPTTASSVGSKQSTKIATTTTTTSSSSDKLEINNNIKVEIIKKERLFLECKYISGVGGKQYKGTVHVSWSANKMDQLKKGDHVECRVVSIDESNASLQLAHAECSKQQTSTIVTLTAQAGTLVTAYPIGQTNGDSVSVHVAPGRVATIDILNNFKTKLALDNFISHPTRGIACAVESINKGSESISLKVIDDAAKSNPKPTTPSVGLVVLAKIEEKMTDAMVVRTCYGKGYIKMIDVCDVARTRPFDIYAVNAYVSAVIVAIDVKAKTAYLSLKRSLLGETTSASNPQFEHAPAYNRINEAGKPIYGYVVGVDTNHPRVTVQISTVANKVVKVADADLLEHVNSIGTIIRLDKAGNSVSNTKPSITDVVGEGVELTVQSVGKTEVVLKSGKRERVYYAKQSSGDDVAVGSLFLAKITSIQDDKTFVTLDPSIVGENQIYDVLNIPYLKKDQPEKCIPIKYKSIDQLLKDIETKKSEEKEEKEEKETLAAEWNLNKLESMKVEEKPSLLLTKRKDREDKEELKTAEEDIVEEEEIVNTKKQKIQKKLGKLEHERVISEREETLLDQNSVPESSGDFERVLLGSPNSSYIWIQYMSFYLGMSEIQKARDIGERALKKILSSEVVEQRNVWVALLNMENMYGGEDTLMTLFKRAILYQDPKRMYFAIIQILEHTEKLDRVDPYFAMFFKKYRHSSKAWIRYAEYLAKTQQLDKLSETLSRLPRVEQLKKKKLIMITSKIGQLEFKHGNPERGRTVFESLISSNPSRTDLWNVYIDQELKQENNAKNIRRLFDRCISLKTSDRNIKQFFKRYLSYEKDHGDESSVNNVKQLAIKYVEESSK